ncbi:hypothetical protein ACQEU5_08470 [Marinactinospora thermotolerans]|uniref:hypothetical protein n=1 Tax=Marinactinospora thermotolerans TaxID=531310 RepID=UPI003D933C23
MTETPTAALHEFAPVMDKLRAEFADVHPETTVSRCVRAARSGLRDVTGKAPPDLVERIARQHLHVLAAAFAEVGQSQTTR